MNDDVDKIIEKDLFPNVRKLVTKPMNVNKMKRLKIRRATKKQIEREKEENPQAWRDKELSRNSDF